MIKFLKVNDIGVVSIDKIEAFNAVVRVGKLKSGEILGRRRITRS